MTIKPDILQEICTTAKLQLQDLYPEAKLLYVHHQSGNLQEIVVSKDFDMPKHPCAKMAQTMLEKNCAREHSSFIGLAVRQNSKWFGLSKTDHVLSVLNINTEQYDSARDCRRSLYHHLWHAIDLLEIRKRPDYSTKFKSGPMVPRRSPMNMARLNLQADAFSATMCALLGEDDAIDILATKRAMDSITPSSHRKAEDYPFPIAYESMLFAYRELKALKPPKQKFMFFARQLAFEVGRAFDDENIHQWWGFSEPAQEMAWHNFSPETILGCAIKTSADPFVRAVGLLVSDITGKDPATIDENFKSFNAYANKDDTKKLHRELMEKAFDDAVSKGLFEESGQPFMIAANKQNEDLTNGVFLGWCANALQAAARAFESALSSGAPPAQAARMQFEGDKHTPDFEDIEKVGQSVIEQKRKGFATTLGDIADICVKNTSFLPVLNSIRMTLKDPAYIQKLETANDITPQAMPARPAFAPSAPAPVAATPATPAFSAPGFGMGGARRAVVATHHTSAQPNKASDTEKGDAKGK